MSAADTPKLVPVACANADVTEHKSCTARIAAGISGRVVSLSAEHVAAIDFCDWVIR